MSGRSRKKNLDYYISLPEIEKNLIKEHLPLLEFQKLENQKERYNRIVKQTAV